MILDADTLELREKSIMLLKHTLDQLAGVLCETIVFKFITHSLQVTIKTNLLAELKHQALN